MSSLTLYPLLRFPPFILPLLFSFFLPMFLFGNYLKLVLPLYEWVAWFVCICRAPGGYPGRG